MTYVGIHFTKAGIVGLAMAGEAVMRTRGMRLRIWREVVFWGLGFGETFVRG